MTFMAKRFAIFIFLYLLSLGKLWAQAPVISSFSPASGPVGTTVTIQGANFNTTTNSNIVYFGVTKGNVTVATANQLTVTVPAGSSYQPISALNTANGLTGYSTNPFITTFPSKHSIASGDFISKASISDTNTPSSFDVGDIDGDGKPDLVVTYYESDSLSIYRNISTDGNVKFAPPVNIVTEGEPTSVKIADMDGDGKPDIILIDSYNNVLQIYLNQSITGSITTSSFGAPSAVSANGTLGSLTIADINGDGKPDLIVMSTSYQNEISMIQNNSTPGHLSLASYTLLEPIGTLTSLFATDIDGDGKPDIIVANGSGTVSVFRNVSNGGTIQTSSFATRQDIVFPFEYISQITAGDLNGDGKPDLMLVGTYSGPFTQGSSTVFNLLNTSTIGNISFSSQSTNALGQGSLISLADIDGDGKPDIVICGGTDATVIRNVSTKTALSFGPNTDVNLGIAYGSVIVADIDGDGKPDLIARDGSANVITVWLNNPLPAPPALPPPPIISSLSPVGAPYNTTIQISGQNFNSSASSNRVTFGATNGQITSASSNNLSVNVPPGSTLSQVSVLNLSNNLAGASENPFIPTLKTPQKLGANSYSTKSYLTGDNPLITCVADINGDGIPDIISLIGSSNSTWFNVYTGTNSTKSFSYAAGISFGNSINHRTGLAIADVDGDGKPDVILHANDQGVTIYLNTSTVNGVSFAPGINIPTGAAILAIADVDGDGKPDIAVSSATGVTFLINSSTPGTVSFSAQTYIDALKTPASIKLADIDGDGKPDLVTTSGGGDSTIAFIYINQSVAGGVSFSGPLFLNIGLGPRVVAAITDMDGDGKPDIISTTDAYDYGETLTVIRNTSSKGNLSFTPFQSFPITSATGIITNNIAIGDVDGDGKPDIVAEIKGSSVPLLSQEVILHNSSTKGNISIDAPLALTTDPSPLYVSVADLDGDGKPEILFDRVSDSNGNIGGLGFFTNGNLIALTSLYTTFDDPTTGKFQIIDTAITVKTLSPFTLKQAIISITQNFTAAEDTLIFNSVPTKTGDIVASYDNTKGILTLTSSTATIAQLQSALQTVSYEDNNSVRPDTNMRVVSFVYTNGSDTSNTAVKNIRVGPGTLTGFPIPIVIPNGPIAFLLGDSVLLSVNPSTGYIYQWAINGISIPNAISPTYTAKVSGAYTVSIALNLKTATSSPINVVAAFILPPDNFKLTITSATCDGSNNGSVNIMAQQSLNYTATITGNGLNTAYPFTTFANINNLAAGSYSVCMTVAGQSGYQQCFDVVISQPADLSVYSTVNTDNKSVNLALTGGTLYNINLNGNIYSTTENTITLPLIDGNNDLIVSTDKLCQGTIEKLINISGEITPYPVPFQNTLNINLGLNNINNLSVEIQNVSNGSLVFSKQYVNQSGVLQLDLTGLSNGIYALHLSMNQSEKIFKIMKQ
jgi:hypothetical protein